jgi:hypothetical protein
VCHLCPLLIKRHVSPHNNALLASYSCSSSCRAYRDLSGREFWCRAFSSGERTWPSFLSSLPASSCIPPCPAEACKYSPFYAAVEVVVLCVLFLGGGRCGFYVLINTDQFARPRQMSDPFSSILQHRHHVHGSQKDPEGKERRTYRVRAAGRPGPVRSRGQRDRP